MAKAASSRDKRNTTAETISALRAAEAARARAESASLNTAAAPSPNASENLPSRNVLLKPLPKTAAATDEDLRRQLLRQAARALASPRDSQNDTDEKVRLATATLDGIAPRDPLEGMLAVQMIAVHGAIMACVGRTTLPNQTIGGHDHHLKQAAKLMTIYERQLAALDKHRGKGQQKITVEHVTVQAGGRAIVGSVETGSRRAVLERGAAPPPALLASAEPSNTRPAMDLSANEMREPKAFLADHPPKKSRTSKGEGQ